MQTCAVQAADTAGSHGTVGLGALDVQFLIETALVLGKPQERETTHTLILPVREHIGEEPVRMVIARFLAGGRILGGVKDVLAVFEQLLAPLNGCH